MKTKTQQAKVPLSGLCEAGFHSSWAAAEQPPGWLRGCEGPYEVWVRGTLTPAVTGVCGCDCHEGQPTSKSWFGEED